MRSFGFRSRTEAAAGLRPPPWAGQGSSGRGRPSRQGATATGVVRGWRRRGQLPGHLGAPGSPKPLPRPAPEHARPNGRGAAAESAPLPLLRAARTQGHRDRGRQGEREREGGRKVKESGRVPTALSQLTQEGRKAQERGQQPHGCPHGHCPGRKQNSTAAASQPAPARPSALPKAASAGRKLLLGTPVQWGRASRAPCAASDATHGLGVPAKGVCGARLQEVLATEVVVLLLPQGGSALITENLKVNQFSVDGSHTD